MQQIMQLSLMDLMSGLGLLTQLALGLASRAGHGVIWFWHF